MVNTGTSRTVNYFLKFVYFFFFYIEVTINRKYILFFSFERKFVQDLRQQQDEAYELSLRADQEKERLKQLEQERLLQLQQQEEEERLEKQRQKEVRPPSTTIEYFN